MPLSCNLGTLTSWNPLGHSRPVTGLLYLYYYYYYYYYYLLQLSFHSVALVLKLVQTKEIRIKVLPLPLSVSPSLPLPYHLRFYSAVNFVFPPYQILPAHILCASRKVQSYSASKNFIFFPIFPFI